ncbi:UNVERIFIED_CONTAM: hypothetical protein RMT77_010415 [Armadillidium vulgare]
MKYFSGCAVLLAIFSCAFALNDEAEIIPTDSDSTPTRNDGEGRVLVVVRPSSFRPFYTDEDPFTRIFNRMFRNSFPFSSFPNRPDTDVFSGTVPEEDSGFDFRPRFPDFSLDFPSFNGPDFDSLPDNYDNTTHEVKVVNGTKIEVNSTISKNKDDNGVFIQEVTIVRYSPEKPSNEGEVPSEVDTTNINTDSSTNSTDVDTNANPSDNEVTNTETGGEDFGSN